MTAKFSRIPHLSDVPFAVQMEPHLIVEFYSRLIFRQPSQ